MSLSSEASLLENVDVALPIPPVVESTTGVNIAVLGTLGMDRVCIWLFLLTDLP